MPFELIWYQVNKGVVKCIIHPTCKHVRRLPLNVSTSFFLVNLFFCSALSTQSVENCVCVLNNLSFQLEAEAPALFSRISALAKPISRGQSQSDVGAIGCFSPQSKSPVQEVRQEHSHATAPGILSDDDYSANILVPSQPSVSLSRQPDSVLPWSHETGVIIYRANY